MDQKVSIGERLREERQRLDMSQTVFAEIGGVTKKTQMLYESGDRSPDAAYLASVTTAGVDALYVLTGRRQGHGIGEAAVHQAVLDAVDLLSLEKKVDAQQLAKAVTKLCAKATSPPAESQQGAHFEGSMQIFHQAPTGGIAGRDIVNTEKTRKG